MLTRICMGIANSDNPLVSKLGETVINRMIDNLENKETEKKLSEYIKRHQLDGALITKILIKVKDESFFHFMQEVVRSQKLNDYHQELLASKKNVLLMETYLAPEGFLEPSKRLSRKAEFIYISGMIEKKSMVGIELLKTYIDNFKRDILTDELLEVALKNDCIASRYLLLRAFLSETQEIYLIKSMSLEMLKDYIEGKPIYQEGAQIVLVENFYELSKRHQEQYGLQPKALQLYHSKRKVEIQNRHPLSTVP